MELVAKAERFKRQRDNMEKKLNAAKEEICDLQDSRAHIRENLDIFKADYRLKCDECNVLELHLQDKGMSKDHVTQFQTYKSAYNECVCMDHKNQNFMFKLIGNAPMKFSKKYVFFEIKYLLDIDSLI